uniref:Uncharacterized protein n=1 Tax=Strigamia maritima TaxID=126957 RepID=T1IRD7_STRMM
MSSQDKRFSRDGTRGGQRRHGGPKQNKHFGQEEAQTVDYDTNSPIIQSFLIYQSELDAKHDKYERLVKCSRDLTIESKRIIFLLHRIKKEEDKESTLLEAEKRLKDLESGLLKQIALELVNEGPYQYTRAYTAGIQEFVEAITFYFYEKEKILPSLQKITDELTNTIFVNLHRCKFHGRDFFLFTNLRQIKFVL